jgi:hypothetical protein
MTVLQKADLKRAFCHQITVPKLLYNAFKNLSLTEQSSAKADTAGLYKTEGLKGIFYRQPNQRISRGLHSQMWVETDECGFVCIVGPISVISGQVRQDSVKKSEEKHHQDRLFVLSVLPQLMIQCIVCNDCHCDGFKCATENGSAGHHCKQCMRFTGKNSNNFHSNMQCWLLVKNTKTEGKSICI